MSSDSQSNDRAVSRRRVIQGGLAFAGASAAGAVLLNQSTQPVAAAELGTWDGESFVIETSDGTISDIWVGSDQLDFTFEWEHFTDDKTVNFTVEARLPEEAEADTYDEIGAGSFLAVATEGSVTEEELSDDTNDVNWDTNPYDFSFITDHVNIIEDHFENPDDGSTSTVPVDTRVEFDYGYAVDSHEFSFNVDTDNLEATASSGGTMSPEGEE